MRYNMLFQLDFEEVNEDYLCPSYFTFTKDKKKGNFRDFPSL